MEKFIRSELYENESVLWCDSVEGGYPSYIVTTHRVIISYFNNRGASNGTMGRYKTNIERSIVFSKDIKEKPKLKASELGDKSYFGVNWETKLGDGYVVDVKVKKRFFDSKLNKSVVIYTSAKKQGSEFIHGFVGNITSPYFLKNINNADYVAELIRNNFLKS